MRRSGIAREDAARIVAHTRLRLVARVRSLAETYLVAQVARGPWEPVSEAGWAAAVDAALAEVLADTERALAAAAVPLGADELDS